MSSLSTLPKMTGFFSYARADDKNSRGRVSKLHKRIQGELCALLGRKEDELHLWQDTGAIPHGTLWQERIEAAVARSVFFIPVVTPSALNSSFCQFEFEAFMRREAELGRSNLIFPILYIDVPELWEEQQRSRHPVLAILHERQYLDWRKFRHDDIDSAEVGRRIEAFCQDVANAMRQPWLPPEERRRKEVEEAARAADEAARLMEEAERRKSEQAIAQARVAEERARQAVEARRMAEETWRSVSQAARIRFDKARQTITDAMAKGADIETGTDVAGPVLTMSFVLKPWKPIKTLAEASAVARFGTRWLYLQTAAFLVYALIIAGASQDRGPGFVLVLASLVSAGCAYGTSRRTVPAAIAGFVVSFMGIGFLAPLWAYAAMRGTQALQKLAPKSPGGRSDSADGQI